MTAPGQRRVYVIDDDSAVLDSTAFLVSALGHECRTFAAPEAFVAELGTLEPGCILTDLRMPGMDGFELAGAVRQRALGWPILMMTSDHGGDLERKAAEHRFVALLRKPVDGTLLEQALADAFEALDA